ncbi:MAG: hypothetical protein SO179_07680 [Bacteroidales bacterium]|nr:hypothetical protein [Bacteroidales bacterium]
MIDIRILNRKEAKKFSYEPHDFKTAIISITDTDKADVVFEKNETNGIRAVLKLKFDDVERDYKNEHCITKEDAENIVKFVNKNKNKVDKFIVHCEAGVSRSAGVGAAIMKALNGDDWDVFKNPLKCPNMKCYRTVLNAFVDAGYFDEDPMEEIKFKEETNIAKWKEFNEID